MPVDRHDFGDIPPFKQVGDRPGDRVRSRSQPFRIGCDVALGNAACRVAMAQEWANVASEAPALNMSPNRGKAMPKGVQIDALEPSGRVELSPGLVDADERLTCDCARAYGLVLGRSRPLGVAE